MHEESRLAFHLHLNTFDTGCSKRVLLCFITLEIVTLASLAAQAFLSSHRPLVLWGQ